MGISRIPDLNHVVDRTTIGILCRSFSQPVHARNMGQCPSCCIRTYVPHRAGIFGAWRERHGWTCGGAQQPAGTFTHTMSRLGQIHRRPRLSNRIVSPRERSFLDPRTQAQWRVSSAEAGNQSTLNFVSWAFLAEVCAGISPIRTKTSCRLAGRKRQGAGRCWDDGTEYDR